MKKFRRASVIAISAAIETAPSSTYKRISQLEAHGVGRVRAGEQHARNERLFPQRYTRYKQVEDHGEAEEKPDPED